MGLCVALELCNAGLCSVWLVYRECVQCSDIGLCRLLGVLAAGCRAVRCTRIV